MEELLAEERQVGREGRVATGVQLCVELAEVRDLVGYECVNAGRVNGDAETAGLWVGAERGLQQVVDVTGNGDIQSRVDERKHDFLKDQVSSRTHRHDDGSASALTTTHLVFDFDFDFRLMASTSCFNRSHRSLPVPRSNPNTSE